MFKRNKLILKPLKIALAVGAIGLAGCASTPLQLPTAADIEQAKRAGTLEQMYADLRLRSKIDPNAAKLSKEIGAVIAEQKIATTLSELDASRLGGAVPIALLNAKGNVVTTISQFDSGVAETLKTQLRQENEKTQSVIRNSNAVFQSSSATIGEQLSALAIVDGLKATNSSDLKGKLLSNAYTKANNFEVKGDYEAASKAWQQLLDAAPDYQDVAARNEAMSGTFRVQQFNHLLASGDANGATKFYLDVAASGADMTDFEDGAGQLVGYYQVQMEAALDDEDYATAMDSAQNMQILQNAGVQVYVGDSIATMTEALMLRAETYSAQDHYGLAMGLLLSAKQLAPNEPLANEMYDNVNDIVFDKSITRLSLSQFSGTVDYPQLGNRIASLIKESVLQSDLTSVKLIERESLDAVFVEKELIALKGGEVNTAVEPADIVIQGEVLTARVDESRRSNRTTKRVVVDIEKTPNPAYQEWLELRESKRAKVVQPPQFNEKPIKEDVQINSELIRVDGMLSVSYRLINPVTATIMSYETLEQTAEFEGENTDGLEIGMFVLESTRADIPSNGQVIAELAEKAATAVSSALIARFNDPVGLFETEAAAYLEKDDDSAAALAYAKAYSYLTSLGEPTPAIKQKLTSLALSSDLFLEN